MDQIKGGYILLARKIINSEIMQKPPLYLKLWVWMLEQANHKNGFNNLKRGQFKTSIKEMRAAMAYKVGNRLEKPTVKEIRCAYGFFAKAHMMGTAKGTGGMVISILNYDKYQTPRNYEGHAEGQGQGHTDNVLPLDNKNIIYIVEFLNKTTNSSYKPTTKSTQKSIIARFNEGYTIQDFKDVITFQSKKWINDPKMSSYLTPSTLFRPANFEKYLNAARRANPKSESPPEFVEGYND